MVFLVESLTLLARAQNFPFWMDLAGSRHASNSKLDVRPVEVKSRLSAKENNTGEKAVDEELVVVLDAAVPKGSLGLRLALWGYQMRTGGYYWIWGIWRSYQPILVLTYPVLLVGMQCPACLLYCQNLGISGLD